MTKKKIRTNTFVSSLCRRIVSCSILDIYIIYIYINILHTHEPSRLDHFLDASCYAAVAKMGCPPATTYNYYYSIFYSTRLNPCCPLLPPAAAAAARPPAHPPKTPPITTVHYHTFYLHPLCLTPHVSHVRSQTRKTPIFPRLERRPYVRPIADLSKQKIS